MKCLLAGLLLAGSAQAAPLQIDADDEAAATLLHTHLDLARALAREAPAALERERLCRLAPEQARELLATLGFFQPARLELDCEAGQLQLRVGPPATLRRIDFQLAGGATVQTDWRRWLALEVGEPFTQATWASAKRGVLVQARAAGHALARWALTQAQVDAQASAVDAQLLLDPGPAIGLLRIDLEGLKHHGSERVDALLGLEAGQPYTEAALMAAQDRLRRSGLFDAVQVELDPDALQGEAMPVRVRVREAPLQQLAIGLGWTANSGPRATLEHLHRLPLGRPLRSRVKLAWARESQAFEAELSSHPGAQLRRNLGSLRWEREAGQEAPYRQTSLRLGRVFETHEHDRSVLIEALASHQGAGAAATRASALALHWNPTWRDLDSVLVPTRGQAWFLQTAAGTARSTHAGLGAQGGFGRVHLRWQRYQPLARGRALALRLEAGQLLAPEALAAPESLRFRAGGDESVRGYTHRALGPTQDGQAVGGRVVWTASLETSHALPKRWMGGAEGFALAAFVDAGQAATRWREAHAAFGAGVGLRWRSPLGLLRTDIAHGQPRHGGGWRVHVALGLAL